MFPLMMMIPDRHIDHPRFPHGETHEQGRALGRKHLVRLCDSRTSNENTVFRERLAGSYTYSTALDGDPLPDQTIFLCLPLQRTLRTQGAAPVDSQSSFSLMMGLTQQDLRL